MSTLFLASASAIITTTSFELISSHARVTSTKSTTRRGVSQLVCQWVNDKGSQWSDFDPITTHLGIGAIPTIEEYILFSEKASTRVAIEIANMVISVQGPPSWRRQGSRLLTFSLAKMQHDSRFRFCISDTDGNFYGVPHCSMGWRSRHVWMDGNSLLTNTALL